VAINQIAASTSGVAVRFLVRLAILCACECACAAFVCAAYDGGVGGELLVVAMSGGEKNGHRRQ
jgi:hypothetical protein